MNGTLRFDSSCGRHLSGVFLGCLVAMLLISGTCTNSQAEENRVSISIAGPGLEEGRIKRNYEELREIILNSFKDALSKDFEIFEDRAEANYNINIDIRGPYQKCFWQVQCNWTEKNSAKEYNCWHPAPTVSYCDQSSIIDIEQIGCLGEIVDFTALDPPPKPPKNPCETNKDVDDYKVVYATCFVVQLEDENWQQKVTKTVQMIPLQIEWQLDEEFKKLGYDIVAERCFNNTTRPQKIDFEIVGWIEERPEKDEIYVSLIVDDMKELGQALDIIEKISGETKGVIRENYKELGDTIVDHIRRHCFESH